MNEEALLPDPGVQTQILTPHVAVVIPCYKVERHVCDVIARIGDEVARIYCVDDCCPHGSGKYIEEHCPDKRVTVLYNERNLGVGGATMAGYRRAAQDGAQIIVKIDGDGQMNPALIPVFIRPIQKSRADYTKGNRFFSPESLRDMPGMRLFGNAVLSFIAKLSTGYWQVIDPANGYTAIHAEVLKLLPLEKISQRYFFETDMLFRLNSINAVSEDIPMDAVYGDEVSNLKIHAIIGEFLAKHALNFIKRIAYNYFLRDFSIASVELIVGLLMLGFGMGFGIKEWLHSIMSGIPVTAGTVMLSSLPVILGVQFLLSFLAYDMRNAARIPLHKRL